MRANLHRVSSIRRALQAWMQQRSSQQRRWISVGLGLVVIACLAGAAIMPRITRASEMNVLGNGGFEQGFRQVPGCGVVGVQWECFTNRGAANYGFYDDMWEPVVYAGKFSQLIEINTKNMAGGDNDRYAGLSQTARVVPGAEYKLSLKGIIRTTNKEGDPWRYSVQVGWLEGPQGDWRDVTNWTDVGWNTYHDRETPGGFSAYETRFAPKGEVITLFIRVWKKWGVGNEELDVNFDEIALEGPSAQHPMMRGDMKRDDMERMPQMGGTGGPVGDMPMGRPDTLKPEGREMPQGRMEGPMQPVSMPMDAREPARDYPTTYRPQLVTGDTTACTGENLVYNGSFEQGFVDVPWGEVGRGWQAFTNGGAANYGFYDEEWDIVVADGEHGQLIEINSKSVYPTDADRYAGIAQQIGGLQPGRVYELTVRGELRGEGNEDDPYRFAAEWGISRDANWQSVDEWTYMDFGPIYVRTEPAPLAQYRVRFEAPAPGIVLFLRGWKKWAVTNVEMDLNLDAISLRACGGGMDKGDWGKPHGQPQGKAMRPQEGSMQQPMERPGMEQPMYEQPMYEQPMYEQPESSGPSKGGLPDNEPEGELPSGESKGGLPEGESKGGLPSDESEDYMPDDESKGGLPEDGSDDTGASCLYIVQPGDMLSAIAERYGVSMDAIARANGITNPNDIYIGQKFEIPGCDDDVSGAPMMQPAPMPEDPAGEPVMMAAMEMPLTGDLSMQNDRPATVPMIGPALRPNVDLTAVQTDPAAALPEMLMARQERTYIVQPGDMLAGIALGEGVDAFALATVNGIDNLNMIYVGQVLVIPN